MFIMSLETKSCQGGSKIPQQNFVDTFLDAVDNAYDVVLDTLKAGVDRGYRVSKGLIEQAQTGQHEALELAQSVAKAPTNVGVATGAVVQTLTKTQARVIESSRGVFGRAQERARQVIRPGRGGNGAKAQAEPRPRRKAQGEETKTE